MSYCTRCGHELLAQARVCAVCFKPRPQEARMAPQPAPAAWQQPVQPIDPGPTDPGPTDPGPTDPGPTDPGPTDPGLATRPVTPITDGGAIASLVLGIGGVLLSWAGVLFIGVSIAAIVVAKRAEQRIAADTGLKGFGMARAGWWLGVIGTFFALIATLAILGLVVR